MRVLVVCDDFYHPARIPRAGLDGLGDSDFSFDYLEDPRTLTAEQLTAYPLLLLTKSNHLSASDKSEWITDDLQATIAAFVRDGKSLLVIHSGSAGYQDSPLIRSVIGGTFLRHPAQCPVTIAPAVQHPITTDIAPFTVVDEHYVMALDDPQAEMILTASSANEAEVQPAGWCRTEGKGRVCVLTPGHNLEVWQHPTYQTIIRNALRWCLL
ncbi:MAG: ThuA domain-containing protein [Anaerolineae bacterium]